MLRDHGRGAGLLSNDSEFCRAPLRPHARHDPADGNGLNPLLQYPEMVIHPPCSIWIRRLYRAFCLRAGRAHHEYPGEKWIHITRRWTMVTWCFLTVGVFLGAHWAYAVLGWGGYWGWDPVEKRLAHALAHRHGVSTFRHHAGKSAAC